MNRYFRYIFVIAFFLMGGVCWGQTTAVGNAELKAKNDIIDSLDFKDTDIKEALKALEAKSGLVITPSEGIQGKATLNLQNVAVLDALKIILDENQLAYLEDKGGIQVITAADFEKEKGFKFTDRLQARSIQPKFTKPLDLAVKLEKNKGANGKVLLTADGRGLILLDSPDKIAEMEELLKQMDVSTGAKVFSLRYVDGQQVTERIKKELTPDVGQAKFDEAGNKITVTDIEGNIARISGIIDQIDQRRDIAFEVKVAKVILADDYKQGIDWAAIVSNYQSFNEAKNGKETLRPVCSGLLTLEDFDILLDAIDTVGVAEFFPGPSMKGTHNERMYIRLNPQSTDLNVTMAAPQINGEGDASDDSPDRNNQFYLIPRIHADGGLAVQVSSPGHGTKSSATFAFKGEHVIVLGGMFKEENIKSIKRFPLLGDLPFVGFAFRRQKTALVKTEYVIFIRPRIEPGQ